MKPRAAAHHVFPARSLGAGPPATQPSTDTADMKFMSADQVFNQMAKPTTRPSRTLAPVPERDVLDRNSGTGAVRPNAPQVPVIREGTLLVDRMGPAQSRRQRGGRITFESDGKAVARSADAAAAESEAR